MGVEDVDSAKAVDWGNYSRLNAESLTKSGISVDWNGSKEQEEILLGNNTIHAALNALDKGKKEQVLKILSQMYDNSEPVAGDENEVMESLNLLNRQGNRGVNLNTPPATTMFDSEEPREGQLEFYSDASTNLSVKNNLTPKEVELFEDVKNNIKSNQNLTSADKVVVAKGEAKFGGQDAVMNAMHKWAKGSGSMNAFVQGLPDNPQDMTTQNWQDILSAYNTHIAGRNLPKTSEAYRLKSMVNAIEPVPTDKLNKINSDLLAQGFNKNEAADMNSFITRNNIDANTLTTKVEDAIQAYNNMTPAYKKSVSLKEWLAIQMQAGTKKYKYDFPEFNLN